MPDTTDWQSWVIVSLVGILGALVTRGRLWGENGKKREMTALEQIATSFRYQGEKLEQIDRKLFEGARDLKDLRKFLEEELEKMRALSEQVVNGRWKDG